MSRRGQRARRGKAKGEVFQPHDVYEEEDSEKASKFNRRFSHIETVNVGLPADFEDESIDEDEAFNDEDYEKFGDLNFGQYKRKRDDEESFEEDDDEDDDEIYQNLSDMLDAPPKKKKEKEVSARELEKHSKLLEKLGQDIERPVKKQKVVLTETVAEGEFSRTTSGVLTMADLLEGVPDTKDHGVLRKDMARFENAKAQLLEEVGSSKVKKDRQLRQVQYKNTSKELSTWQPTVMQLNKQQHLSFPLVPEKNLQPTTDSLAVTEPSTDMEKMIAALVQDASEKEKKIIEGEELMMRKLSAEEKIQKEIELAKMRHLLFYKEKKMASKRYRRILRKQKEKQKLTLAELRELDPEAAREEIIKREKERALERMTLKHKTTGKWAKGAARHAQNPENKRLLNEHHKIGEDLRRKIEGISDDEESDSLEYDSEGYLKASDSEDEEDVLPTKGLFAMKFMQRDRERQKQEYNEMKAEYRRDVEAEKAERDKQAKALHNDWELPEEEEKEEEGTKLHSGRVTFGKAQPTSISTETIFDFSHGMSHRGPELTRSGQQTDSVAFGSGFTSKVDTSIDLGRKRRVVEESDGDFDVTVGKTEEGGSFQLNKMEIKESAISPKKLNKKQPEPKKQLATEPPKQEQKQQKQQIQQPKRNQQSQGDNPWLNNNDDDSDIRSNQSNKNPWLNEDDSDNSNKNKQRKTEAREPEIKLTTTKAKKAGKVGEASNLKKLKDITELINETNRDQLDADDVDETVEFSLAKSDKSQKELISRAFSHDDVKAEFEEEKRKLVERDLPQDDTPAALPGWGAWGGEGIVAKPRRPDPQKLKELEEKRAEALKKRQDARLKHVIIHSKKEKKLLKYQIQQAPRGMTKQAFEKSLKMPLGPDWNTQMSVQELTKPKIQVKRGQNIDPIESKLVSADKKHEGTKKRSPGKTEKRKSSGAGNPSNKTK